MRLAASQTGVAQPDAERRVEDAIAVAIAAAQKALSAVTLGSSTAASLLVGLHWRGTPLHAWALPETGPLHSWLGAGRSTRFGAAAGFPPREDGESDP